MKRAVASAAVALSCLAAVSGVLAKDRPATPTSGGATGEALFVRKCGICHLDGGTGTMMLARRLGDNKALLAQRSDLSPRYVETVVRRGINSMPTITRVELSDAELGAIVKYLTDKPANPANRKTQ